jgi:DNA-binding NtrC family response regulator
VETKISILIVDDDEGDRRQIKRALKGAGMSCECTEAWDVDQAMAACEARAFDCAVIDYRLPGADGLAALTALHDLYPHMAIVMSTGRVDEEFAAEAMKRGACDFISKTSLDARSMQESIEMAVERSRLERQDGPGSRPMALREV